MSDKILGLRTCCYIVDDLEKAKKWYSEVFEVEPYFDEPFYVGFSVGGYELGLMPNEEEKAVERSTGVLTYWGVENIEVAFRRLLSAGATTHEEPHNVGGEIVVCSVYDPDGNIIGLISNPDFTMK